MAALQNAAGASMPASAIGISSGPARATSTRGAKYATAPTNRHAACVAATAVLVTAPRSAGESAATAPRGRADTTARSARAYAACSDEQPAHHAALTRSRSSVRSTVAPSIAPQPQRTARAALPRRRGRLRRTGCRTRASPSAPMAAAAAGGHPLNAAFAAWVERAVASDPSGDWSGAVAAYCAHCDALFAEAQQQRQQPAAKKATPPPAFGAFAAPAAQAQGGAEPGPLLFFGQRAAEPPARREDNPFAQGLDLDKEARGSCGLAALRAAAGADWARFRKRRRAGCGAEGCRGQDLGGARGARGGGPRGARGGGGGGGSCHRQQVRPSCARCFHNEP